MNGDNPSERSWLDRFKASTTWNVIQIVLPLVAISVPIILFTIGRCHRELTITGIQETRLINATDSAAKDVDISYGGKRAANIIRYLVEIRNSGNASIDGRDIHYLRWLPPNQARILTAIVKEKTSGYGDFISLHVTNNLVEFHLLTLNRDAVVIADILCAAEVPSIETHPTVEGAITDAKVVDMSGAANTREKTPSFIGQVFAGSIWVLLVKLLVFSIIGICLLALVAISVEKTAELRTHREFDRITREFMKTNKFPDTLDQSDAKYFGKTIKYLSALTLEQIVFIRNKLAHSKYDMGIDVTKFVESFSSERDRKDLRELPDHDTLNEIIRYQSLYHLETFCDVFLGFHRKKT